MLHEEHVYWYGHVEACCDMSWISALCECTMRLNNVEKDWKHVLTQKFVNLNTYCDITCRTFQLPHITISSFQSHWWQPTTGSLQSHKRLKERNNLQSDKKSCAIHKLAWWHFQVGWASGWQFVFLWYNVNNQKYVWIIPLKMTFFGFPKVQWLHLTGEVDNL